MKTIRCAIPFLLLLVLAPSALCQVGNRNHEAYRDKCPALHSADPATLLKYLTDNKPAPQNAVCITWAIYGVGDRQYEPAIPVLIGLLEFQRPSTTGTWGGLPGSPYPAVEALEDIGKPALPALLTEIKASMTSDLSRTNATRAWILVYGKHEKEAQGFAALRREAMNNADDAVKKRLDKAIQGALEKGCLHGPQGDDCRQSAVDGVDR